jgi:hypothetical protein
MFLVGDGRIFHLNEGWAWQLRTVAAVGISTLVNGTVIQWAYFLQESSQQPRK